MIGSCEFCALCNDTLMSSALVLGGDMLKACAEYFPKGCADLDIRPTGPEFVVLLAALTLSGPDCSLNNAVSSRI